MAKGIIYIMTTVVPGLIKIGKTSSQNFDQRMYQLEHNGYCNVTALKRVFAIEVDDYDTKEALLHTIFEKSQVSDTELFALDINVAIQLLSSFEGTIIYPKTGTREEIFTHATENVNGKQIPNGTYTLKKKKKSDNKVVCATAVINNGKWKLLKGSILGISEDKGVSQKAKKTRTKMSIDVYGKLISDFDLGECTPSFAGTIVMNQAINGWDDWHDENGDPVDKYRKKITDTISVTHLPQK